MQNSGAVISLYMTSPPRVTALIKTSASTSSMSDCKGHARSSSEQGSEAWETRSRVLRASKEQDMHGNGGLGFSTDAAPP